MTIVLSSECLIMSSASVTDSNLINIYYRKLSIFLNFKIMFSLGKLGTSWSSCILVTCSCGLMNYFIKTCHSLIYQWIFHKKNVLKCNKVLILGFSTLSLFLSRESIVGKKLYIILLLSLEVFLFFLNSLLCSWP